MIREIRIGGDIAEFWRKPFIRKASIKIELPFLNPRRVGHPMHNTRI